MKISVKSKKKNQLSKISFSIVLLSSFFFNLICIPILAETSNSTSALDINPKNLSSYILPAENQHLIAQVKTKRPGFFQRFRRKKSQNNQKTQRQSFLQRFNFRKNRKQKVKVKRQQRNILQRFKIRRNQQPKK
jgi:hypothetical protein